MTPRTVYTFKLDATQQRELAAMLSAGPYRPMTVPYTIIAVEGDGFNVALYTSGKCVVQGRGAADWVLYHMEPHILKRAAMGYEDVLDPQSVQPHMGIDESGKGDFFGPMVIAAAYVDHALVEKLRAMDVRDSKTVTSDRKAEEMARDIRDLLKDRFATVVIGPRAYNRLYSKMRSVNTILAWGHARAIENLLEKVPDCPRALSDQFGPKRQIERALLAKGRAIKLDQRPKAESDMAVAAASLIARADFLKALRALKETYGGDFHKGASEAVRRDAERLVKTKGPAVLLDVAKCHFRTTDQVLDACGHTRMALGPDGQAISKPRDMQSS